MPPRGFSPLDNVNLVLERVDSQGKHLWGVRFGTDRRDWAVELLALPDGGCLVLAHAGLHEGRPATMLYRFDSSGAKVWGRQLDDASPSGMALDLPRNRVLVSATVRRTMAGPDSGLPSHQRADNAFVITMPLD